MKILAADTSSAVASVAVMEDSTLLGEYTLNHKKTHSQKLVPMINEILKNLELTPEEIDAFAVSIGPGSFTGLRIGVTTIKAMAYALQKQAIGVPTLDTLAFNIPFCDSLICPIIDARNNQVYTSLYEWKGKKQERLSEYVGITIGELIDTVKAKNREAFFVGDGVNVYKDTLLAELGNRCIFPPNNLLLQRASAVAEIAIHMQVDGKGFENEINTDKTNENNLESWLTMVPFYLRKSQAERLFEQR
ncbi:MAG TPA: tRNA (adenosine(37)-N6)-threonylcarbamoyltransferase complex dimerization subunit type 1 TsaB [Clostridiales bacterium]|nr:tRNA (adenosine(37)-N6)-threonylcarbamoyltransferase complex dimerization subunit type 1 TsaB [Clostridiales bacterium]